MYITHTLLFAGQSDREGTEVDAAAVESAFCALGFDVTRHDEKYLFSDSALKKL